MSAPANYTFSMPPAESTAIAGSVLPIKRAEELLETLPGVISVRVVASANGAVEEIHLLTSEEVSPKQTVRNVESALMAHLGMRVSHKKISVATTSEPARATLTAIGQSGETRPLTLEGVKVVEAFEREFVFVGMRARFGRESVLLTGSAEVRESRETAAVLAVLDATNRWIEYQG